MSASPELEEAPVGDSAALLGLLLSLRAMELVPFWAISVL